jgi:hypothetical protein
MSLATEITRIAGIKDNLITAIEAKNVTVPADVTLDELPPLIDSIPTDDGSYRDLVERDAVTPTLPEFPTGSGLKEYAFYGCTNLALTSLPYGVTSISNFTFYGCTSLALTSLPSGITSIGSYAFYQCTSLALTSLPSGITSINTYTFRNCSRLALTSLPSGITSIGTYAFYSCTSLTTLTFQGTPTSIPTNSFQSCTNLTIINVPWSSGAVANAPWGATNATINYNYTP